MLIHRYWSEPPYRPSHTFITRTLRQLHPAAELQDWTDVTLPKEALELADRTAAQVHPAYYYRHRSNVISWWLLMTFGGWWADHDLVPITPFSELPSPATAAHRGGQRCTSWRAFPKGHPLPAAAVAQVLAAPDNPSAISSEVSGERLLTRLADQVDGITALPLPIDLDGRRHPWAPLWCIHLHESA